MWAAAVLGDGALDLVGRILVPNLKPGGKWGNTVSLSHLRGGPQRKSHVRDPGRGANHPTLLLLRDHYDPENVGFGPLVCHDDHLLRGGAGFPEHPHRDVEIVTWVLSGAVVQTASVGPPTTVGAGQVQVLSAGSGVLHSEITEPGAGADAVRPDVAAAGSPVPRRRTPRRRLPRPWPLGLVPVVSGHDGAAAARIVRVRHPARGLSRCG